jgi:hypothetical protein
MTDDDLEVLKDSGRHRTELFYKPVGAAENHLSHWQLMSRFEFSANRITDI